MTRPADRAFVPSGAPLPVVARVPGASRLTLQVDGGPVIEADTTTGEFAATLPPLSRGRHVLVAKTPEIVGLSLTRELFVDRMPDDRIDGYGFQGADWMMTLSDARPADDGLFAGALTLAWVGTSEVGSLSRRLAEHAVSGEVSPGYAPHIAWLEEWSHGQGTLHVDTAQGDPARAQTYPGVRAMGFAPDGWSLLSIDDGAFLLETPYVTPRRIADEADGAAFVGPAEDLLTWKQAADGVHVSIASSPGFDPVAIGPLVVAPFVANPSRREVAMRRAEGDALGSLLLYQIDTEANALLYGAVSAFGFSPDGSWLLAITSANGQGAGNLSLLRRQPPSQAFTVAGSFIAASFDDTLENVYALEANGTFVGIDLASEAVTPLAADAVKFAALRDGALLWQDSASSLWIRRVDGAVENVGQLNPAYLEVALSPDGRLVAFTEASGAVRRVDLATGQRDDFGLDAHRPAFLAEGAFAWAERRADAQTSGLANDDLWVFPAWPESFQGAQLVAPRVDSSRPFEVSPDATTLAVLVDLPRLGERWEARALCVDAHVRHEDLGPADASRREIRYRFDGRMIWFGEDRALYLAPCRPE